MIVRSARKEETTITITEYVGHSLKEESTEDNLTKYM